MANTYASPMVQTPIIGTASVATALTTRTNITGTTGLTQLTAVDATQPTRVDAIQIQAAATTANHYMDISRRRRTAHPPEP